MVSAAAQTDSGFSSASITVGLMAGNGEVRLGRELTAAYNAIARYDVFRQRGYRPLQLAMANS